MTLDQLRALVAVVDEGSFSAAARRLRRVQSAVSHAMAALERQLGVALFDRTKRVPTLTPEGRLVLAQARRVLAEADALARTAQSLESGLEPLVAIGLDAIFPTTALVALGRGFADAFPRTELRVFTETLSAVSKRVQDGSCHLGVVGPAADTRGLERVHLAEVRLVPVAAREHPLASHKGTIPSAVLREHVQIILSERGEGGVADQGVLSDRTWRVVDLGTKHALVQGGLGWGNMPEHVVREAIAEGSLVRLRPAAWSDDEHVLSLALVHRPDLAMGPATRWTVDHLRTLCVEALDQRRRTSKPTKSARPAKTATVKAGRKASDV
jgi:DNA-binding transcriptional LysR family regulator